MNGDKRFLDPSQPQTLQIGVLLLYVNAAFKLLGGAFFSIIGLVLVGALAGGGYGIANEQRWGYQVGVGAAFANLLLPIAIFGLDAAFSNAFFLLGVIFDVALVALLLHPHSREYQKIWFR